MASADRKDGEAVRENKSALVEETSKTDAMTVQERDVHSCPTADCQSSKDSTDANRDIPQCCSGWLPKQHREK